MKKKHLLWLVPSALLLLSLNRKSNKIGNNISFKSPVKNPKIRGCDTSGCGGFGESRGDHLHNGVDIYALPGQTILAPITGKVRPLYVYTTSTQMKGVEISSGNVKVKLFYVNHGLNLNDIVVQGQKIGIAQDIAGYHNAPQMTPHIHIEIYVDNKLIDPTKHIV